MSAHWFYTDLRKAQFHRIWIDHLRPWDNDWRWADKDVQPGETSEWRRQNGAWQPTSYRVVLTVISINMGMGEWWREICVFVHDGDGGRGERDEQMSAITHTRVQGERMCVCVISHTRKKRTTLYERMRGSWDEDESNTVYTLNTLQTHFHLKHLTLTAACQLRPLFNNSAEGFQQVKLSNSEIKFKWNPPQTCQCCVLRHWNILKVESALLSLNCCFLIFSLLLHKSQLSPLSDH